MASAKSTTPALRFKGFDVEWEEQKASKIFLTVADKGHPKLPVLSATQDRGMIKRIHTGININHDERNEITYKRVMPGQFVIHLRSFQGGLAHSTTEGITSPAYTVMDFIHNEHQYDQYWKHIFNSEKFIKSLEAVTYGIRDGRSISFDDLSTLSFTYPDAIEQKRIGNYFQNLDSLIALQRRKLVKLQNVKKAMLQKMFPARGSTTPQIRFAGFTEPWQERKLGGLCSIFTDGDWIESKDQSDYGVRLIQTGNVGVAEFIDKPNNSKWISEETFERLHCKEVLPGDILISRLPEPAGRACIIPNLGTKMITAVDCTIVRTTTDYCNEYLIQYLSSQEYFNEVSTVLAGGTRQRISRSSLANFTVPVPPDHKEQQAIGNYFSTLDTRISLQQRKLEKLQNIKKACLAAMFV